MLEVACVAGQLEVACGAEHGVHGGRGQWVVPSRDRLTRVALWGSVPCKVPRPVGKSRGPA
eukprot:4061692-Lingulodinium_polyedra.AAC.1